MRRNPPNDRHTLWSLFKVCFMWRGGGSQASIPICQKYDRIVQPLQSSICSYLSLFPVPCGERTSLYTTTPPTLKTSRPHHGHTMEWEDSPISPPSPNKGSPQTNEDLPISHIAISLYTGVQLEILGSMKAHPIGPPTQRGPWIGHNFPPFSVPLVIHRMIIHWIF